MKRLPTSVWLFAVALVAIWLLVLGWAARIPWSAPLFPQREVLLNGRDFRPVIGAGVEDDTALGVGAIADDGNALQTTSLEHVRAADFPILRYHFDGFPRTLELSLVFRCADAPNDVQAISMPWPGDGMVSVNLGALPAWHGEIVELGFAEYATPQLVPSSIAFHPFRLDSAQLQSPSWRSLPALLRSAWFGYQPWSLASINALGGSADSLQTASITPALGVGAFLSLLAAAWLFRWSRRRLLQGALIVAALAWVLLDVRWLDDFSAKHALVEKLYAGKTWQERARLQPDEDIAGMAQLTRQQTGGFPAQQRILIASDPAYSLLRLVYFLLPLDAALLDQAMGNVPATGLPADILIVLYTSKTWQYDEPNAVLRNGAMRIPAAPVFIGGQLKIYHTLGAQP